LKSLLRTDIEHTLHLSSYYRSRTDYGSLTREFYQTLENVALQRLGLPSDSIDHAANIKELETQGLISALISSPIY